MPRNLSTVIDKGFSLFDEVLDTVIETVAGSKESKKKSGRPDHPRRRSSGKAASSHKSRYWNEDDEEEARVGLEQARYLEQEKEESEQWINGLDWDNKESDFVVLETEGSANDRYPCHSCSRLHNEEYNTTRRVLTLGFQGEETAGFLEACCRDVSRVRGYDPKISDANHQ
jgi:hypothetical protein